jgi:hypothetical protein
VDSSFITNPSSFQKNITTEVAGYSQVLFKWNYTGSWEWYWAIDDISVTADIAVPYNVAIFFLSLDSTICYDALENITVAGPTYSVDLLSGSASTFIAGQSINFLPGFHAHDGSQMNAYITLTGAYCNSLPSPANEQLAEKSMWLNEGTKPIAQGIFEKTVKIYPNPNNGKFTIELTNFEGPSIITIANTIGAIVYQTTVNKSPTSEFELTTLKKGLYFVSIKNGDFIKTNKIIVQ